MAVKLCVIGASDTLWTQKLSTMLQAYSGGEIQADPYKTSHLFFRLRYILSSDGILYLGVWPNAINIRFLLFKVLLRIVRLFKATPQEIYYWIGQDVFSACNDKKRGWKEKYIWGEMQSSLHFAASQNLSEELVSVGIQGNCVLFPSELPDANIIPLLPEVFSVLCYVPAGLEEYYGYQAIEHAARALPDVPFYICGNDGKVITSAPDNLIFAGYVENMAALMQQHICVVRNVKHDAISAFVREALYLERHVIYSDQHPFTQYVAYQDSEALLAAVKQLKEQFAKNSLGLNKEGRAYASEHYTTARRVQNLIEQVQEALH
jgi:hypothetical protein